MELLYGKLPEFFQDEEELRGIWSASNTRKRLLRGLAEQGFGREQPAEMQRIILDHYVKVGVEELDPAKLTPLLRLRYHNSIADTVADIDPAEHIRQMFAGFQQHYLYVQAA